MCRISNCSVVLSCPPHISALRVKAWVRVRIRVRVRVRVRGRVRGRVKVKVKVRPQPCPFPTGGRMCKPAQYSTWCRVQCNDESCPGWGVREPSMGKFVPGGGVARGSLGSKWSLNRVYLGST